VLGARVGIADHVTIGEGAQLAARSSVMRDVPRGARYAGLLNAKPVKQYWRELATFERLARGHGKTD
jgi:UDP-3-O-[3-hydroxymyristoyl] glucosamine N-acyltransferase